jgi:hypothetical protein
LTAITAVTAVSTVLCLVALAAAGVLYLRRPLMARRSYSEEEFQQHASAMLAQIERYLSRSAR